MSTRSIRIMCVISISVLVSLVSIKAISQVPKTLNYQGILNDSAGAPINAIVPVTFIIYDAATNGNALWTETQNVTVANGVYNVILGTTTPIIHFIH